MTLLSATIDEPPRPDQHLLVFQSSAAQSSLPLLSQLLSRSLEPDNTACRTYTLLFCLLYRPSTLLPVESGVVSSDHLKAYDLAGSIPGYGNDWSDPREKILLAVQNAPPGSINVIIDSVDTLSSDVGSLEETYRFLRDLHSLIRVRQSPSRLILHVLQPSQFLPLLVQTAFSPSLIHVSAHHPSLISYLAKDYLTPPPPLSHDAKFWGVFLPVSERSYDTDCLVFGGDGEGSGNSPELVVDILVRGLDASGRKRGVERLLEGWSPMFNGACDLMMLESMKNIGSKRAVEESAPDPTRNMSFNLSLTPSQHQSRAQVPLPYAHEGKPPGKQTTQAAIFYDPDSADDIDDDDPDEDLDI